MPSISKKKKKKKKKQVANNLEVKELVDENTAPIHT
jgi:hypothetical protein